jgi:phosphoglycerate kinase
MKTLSDISLKNKKILIRADLNVPLDDNKQVTDANRIKQFIPTLKYVVENGGIPIVMSHFDDPKGVPNDDLSLRHIVSKFAELSNLEVVMAKDCIGDSVQKQIEALKANQVLLLENLRFHSGETANNQEFAKQLAKLADVYVSDAFATAIVHTPLWCQYQD